MRSVATVALSLAMVAACGSGNTSAEVRAEQSATTALPPPSPTTIWEPLPGFPEGVATATARFVAPCVADVRTTVPTRIEGRGAGTRSRNYAGEGFDQIVSGAAVLDFRDRVAAVDPGNFVTDEVLRFTVSASVGEPGSIPNPPYEFKFRDLASSEATIDECLNGAPSSGTDPPEFPRTL
jgi:hypothetical protein